jgi:hypothetical protein
LRQGGADEAGGAGDQDAHGWNPMSAGLLILPAAARGAGHIAPRHRSTMLAGVRPFRGMP